MGLVLSDWLDHISVVLADVGIMFRGVRVAWSGGRGVGNTANVNRIMNSRYTLWGLRAK
jgi:hypothetical protein